MGITRALVLVAIVVVLAACSGPAVTPDDPPETTAQTEAVETDPAQDPVDANGSTLCRLLSPTVLGANSSADWELDWVELGEVEPGVCAWRSENQFNTVAVSVAEGVETAALGPDYDQVPLGVTNAWVRNQAGVPVEVLVPAGGDRALILTQDSSSLDTDAMLALAFAAAVALDGLGYSGPTVPGPAGSGGTDAGGSGSTAEPVLGTELWGTATLGGPSFPDPLELDVAVPIAGDEPVWSAFEEGRQVICANPVTLVGTIFESTTGIDLIEFAVVDDDASGPGLARLSVVLQRESGFDSTPGTYPALGHVRDTEGRNLDGEGEVEVDAGLQSGTFRGADPSGNPFEITWACGVR